MASVVDKQYIIAIGASAGGLEAISVFFDFTPLDAVSYIVIQHLSSDFKSQMAQILKNHTQLQVIEVTDDIEIESNKVYLIPSTNFMVIENGKLILSDKKDMPRPHMTIDHFFTSLAKERGEKAIGVILSGTGADGSKGVEAIKKAGGYIIVQDPDTAGFNEMPKAAIKTGFADVILAPEGMPQRIEDYVNNGFHGMLTAQDDEEISETDLTGIFALIKGCLPLDFTEYKRPTILRRIKKRMEEQSFIGIDKYYQYLQKNSREVELLANDFLIGVTSFFRDPEAFRIIDEEVIPDILRNKGQDDILKIWVAGCATGEEAYSLAILIKEHISKDHNHLEVKIFATDINKTALNIGSKGRYGDSIRNSMSEARLKKYFVKTETGYQISHEIRKMLIFAQHDLGNNSPYCHIDLISCRNLLIYMNTDLQKKVFSMMHFGLKKDGYLFLGPSESAAVLRTGFKEISNKWNIYKSTKSDRKVRLNTFSSPVFEEMKPSSTELSSKADIPMSTTSIVDEINLAVFEESGYSGVCTDENLRVLRSFGDPSEYLKNEIFNFNLNDLLPDHISLTFKAAAHKAGLLNKRIVLKGLKFENKLSPLIQLVDIVIKPIVAGKSHDKLLLILFKRNKTKLNGSDNIQSIDIEQLTKDHLYSLENELAEAKLNLETAYERIASSNENMQSFNEELLSANEEMQSANEELQSLNEELQTINKEHQLTNAELTESNDDLNNYFRSNLNGQLFVDKNLLLKNYSPAAVKHINIRESDIGRPLSNITTNIKLETLIDDIKIVIDHEETIIREAISSDGKTYQVMTMPYLRKDTLIADGAIVSFYDISELKKLFNDLDISNNSLLHNNEKITRVNKKLEDRNEQLKNSRNYTEEIFNTIHDPLVVLDTDLRVIRATDGFYQMFKVDKEDTEGNLLFELGNKQWDIPLLHNQLINILPERGSFKAIEVDHEFNLIGRKIMRLTARQFDTHTSDKLILLAIHDLTDTRKVEEGLAEAERLLAENKERLHFAIESAGIGAWDFNPVSKELIWDNRCKELFGLLPGDPLDHTIFLNLIHPNDRLEADDIINKTLKGVNNGELNIEYRSLGLHDQKVRWLKSQGKAYFDDNNEAIRFIGTLVDISMEKELEASTKELLIKKDEFISIASHELKTPVTSLKASLQLLSRMKNNPSPAMLPVLLDQSSRSMEKITTLIDDLLSVTRMNEGQLRLNKTNFAIVDLLNECCSHVRAAGKHELIVDGDKALKIFADEHRIEQVLVNLVNNAVKYSPDSRNIYLSVKKENGMAKVSVKDKGPGIPADKLEHLFDRYYRENHSGEKYSGLGLGLYISSEIIKRHEGLIGVESKVGKGSTFWFLLPIAADKTGLTVSDVLKD